MHFGCIEGEWAMVVAGLAGSGAMERGIPLLVGFSRQGTWSKGKLISFQI